MARLESARCWRARRSSDPRCARLRPSRWLLRDAPRRPLWRHRDRCTGRLESTGTGRSPAVSKVDVGQDLNHRDRLVRTPVLAEGQTARFDRGVRFRRRELLGMAIPPTSLGAEASPDPGQWFTAMLATQQHSLGQPTKLLISLMWLAARSGYCSAALVMAWASDRSVPFCKSRARSRRRVKPEVSITGASFSTW